AQEAQRRLREAAGRARARDPQDRRPRVQRRLAQAAGRDPVRRAEAAGRPAQQDRRLVDAKTGRIHTSYMMTGAATGRLASTDPNLQNIPVRTEEGRKIREAFIAEQGHKLVSADYSQIELRLLAHVADLATLKEAFARGDDIHAITASEMFGVPVKGMDPLVRRRAKAINFGIIYGISAFGLANQLGIGQPE